MPKAKGPKRLIEMEYVPVSRVRPNERNPYKEDPETFQALRRSVDKTGGIVDPIDVAPDSEPEKNSTWDASDKKGKWYVVIHLGKAVDAPQGPSPHVLKFLKKVARWKFIPSKVYVNALHAKVALRDSKDSNPVRRTHVTYGAYEKYEYVNPETADTRHF